MSLAHTYIHRKDLEAVKRCLQCAAHDAQTTKELEEGLAWLSDERNQAHLKMILESLELSGDLLKTITIEDEDAPAN